MTDDSDEEERDENGVDEVDGEEKENTADPDETTKDVFGDDSIETEPSQVTTVKTA